MNTLNTITFTLTSTNRWGTAEALEIQNAVRSQVHSQVVVKWEIDNWDRFNVVDDHMATRYHVFDSVKQCNIVSNLKSRSDAARLALLMNNSFNDTTSLERG